MKTTAPLQTNIKLESGNIYHFSDPTHTHLHRTDGPAVELVTGYRAWYSSGRLHRADGPAIEYPDGNVSYYINGKEMSAMQYHNWQLHEGWPVGWGAVEERAPWIAARKGILDRFRHE